MTILVTGGAGFIGSNFVLDWFQSSDEPIVNLDALTYAGNLSTLRDVDDDPRYEFVKGNIGDRATLEEAMAALQEQAVRVEAMASRSVSASASVSAFGLEPEDPLAQHPRAALPALQPPRGGSS